MSTWVRVLEINRCTADTCSAERVRRRSEQMVEHAPCIHLLKLTIKIQLPASADLCDYQQDMVLAVIVFCRASEWAIRFWEWSISLCLDAGALQPLIPGHPFSDLQILTQIDFCADSLHMMHLSCSVYPF